LWRGRALDGTATGQVRDRLCADLVELHIQAQEEAFVTGIQLGRHRQLLPQLARLTAESPTRERIVLLYMLALYRDSRAHDALNVFSRTRLQLIEQLGLEPGPPLQRLHRAILLGQPIRDSWPASTGPARRSDAPIAPVAAGTVRRG
jgi:DNA-binding SARP family transcriptional activator